MISFTDIVIRLPGNRVLVMKRGENANPEKLSEAESQQVQKLRRRDREVRAHESRHIAGQDVVPIGGPHYTYAIGPDGKPYAVGGSVTVTTGISSDPDTALRKARSMRDAALAPGEASSRDLAAAGSAKAMEMEALAAKAREGKGRDVPAGSTADPSMKAALDIYRQQGSLMEKLLDSGLSPDEETVDYLA